MRLIEAIDSRFVATSAFEEIGQTAAGRDASGMPRRTLAIEDPQKRGEALQGLVVGLEQRTR